MKSFLQYLSEEKWEDQKFSDGETTYSVAKVVAWAKRNGDYVDCLPIKDTDGLEWWEKEYGDEDGNPKNQKQRELLKKADLSYPILVIRMGDSLSVADGLHRVKKASMSGKKCLPAYVIQKKDLKKIGERDEDL